MSTPTHGPRQMVYPMFTYGGIAYLTPVFPFTTSFIQTPSSIANRSPVLTSHTPPPGHEVPAVRQASIELISSIGSILVQVFEWIGSNEPASVTPVVVGGYAHIARFYHKNHAMRRIGTCEYGLRDLDLVLAPKVTPTSTFEEYEQECQYWIEHFDSVVNKFAALSRYPSAKYMMVEFSYASTDHSVACRKSLSSFSVQRVFKTNEYGSTYIFHLDQHQLANVTILQPKNWHVAVRFDPMWMVFPAFKLSKAAREWIVSRPIVRANIVSEDYLLYRLSMQLISCQHYLRLHPHDRFAMKKFLLLRQRRSLWSDLSFVHDLGRDVDQWHKFEKMAQKRAEDNWRDEQALLLSSLNTATSKLNRYREKCKSLQLLLETQEYYRAQQAEARSESSRAPNLPDVIQCPSPPSTVSSAASSQEVLLPTVNQAPQGASVESPRPARKKKVTQRSVMCVTETQNEHEYEYAPWSDIAFMVVSKDSAFVLFLFVFCILFRCIVQ